MTAVALMAAVAESAAPGRFGLNGWAAAVATVLGAGTTAWIAVVKVIEAKRARVSGDEKQTREDIRTDRHDTVAEWRELVEQKDRDIERKDRETAAVTADRDRWKRIAEEYERLHDEDRVVRMVHGAWDFTTYEAAYRAELPVSPPPPLTAPRAPREDTAI